MTSIVPASSTKSTSSSKTTTATTLEDAITTVDIVKEQIQQYDTASSKYKAVLRNITTTTTTTQAASSSSDTNTTTLTNTNDNSVSIEWIKADSGAIIEAPSKLLLQLSSPVEEATLYLTSTNTTTTKADQTTIAVFRGVETNQATLSITANWENATVTASSETTYTDVSKLTNELLDVLQLPPSSTTGTTTKPYETTLQIPIMAAKTGDVASTNNKSNNNNSSSKEEAPVQCTISIRVQYIPSHKDIREELCEIIGKIATQKAIAREELRTASLVVHELSKQRNPKPTTTTGGGGTVVKSGFLQNDKSAVGGGAQTSGSSTTTTTTPTPTTTKWYQVWYDRTVATTTVIVPLFKNYFYFIAFTMVSHYYGHQLAIPPPV